MILARPPRFLRSNQPRLDLSYIHDLLDRVEAVFDLSVEGVLRQLFPQEAWTGAFLAAHADRIGSHLGEFAMAYERFRTEHGQVAPLTQSHLRSILLFTRYPGLTKKDLTFSETTLSALAVHYLTLVAMHRFEEEDLPALREIVSEMSLLHPDQLTAWLEPHPADVVLYLVLRHFVTSLGLPNPGEASWPESCPMSGAAAPTHPLQSPQPPFTKGGEGGISEKGEGGGRGPFDVIP